MDFQKFLFDEIIINVAEYTNIYIKFIAANFQNDSCLSDKYERNTSIYWAYLFRNIQKSSYVNIHNILNTNGKGSKFPIKLHI